jgi:hypothetical protein
MANTQIRGSSQILDATFTKAKVVADFLAAADWNITNGSNNATITGVKDPVNNQDVATKKYVDDHTGTNDTLDTAYNNYGATPANIIVDNTQGQGSVEWQLTPSAGFLTASFIVSDGSGTNDILTISATNAGARSVVIAANAASNFSVTGANLTLSTITSGALNLTAAGNMVFTAASAISWTNGTNVWTPQQTGLRLANYATAGLPATPGATSNYGAIAFDTTADRPVVWVTNVDGLGTDGWAVVMTTSAYGKEVWGELPTLNTGAETATLAYTPLAGTERVYLNGLRMIRGASYDYTIATNVITFTSPGLQPNDQVTVDYRY